MVDICELLKYNAQVRHRYFEAFTTLPWEKFTKNREASFYSFRDIFLHTLNVVDYWPSFLQKESYTLTRSSTANRSKPYSGTWNTSKNT